MAFQGSMPPKLLMITISLSPPICWSSRLICAVLRELARKRRSSPPLTRFVATSCQSSPATGTRAHASLPSIGFWSLHGEVLIQGSTAHLLFPYCLKARVLLCREVVLPVPNHAFPQEAGNREIHHGVPCAIGKRVRTHARK